MLARSRRDFVEDEEGLTSSLAQVYMEDDYVRKMLDEVDMDNDVRIYEDIRMHYWQEIGKIVDCSEAFITTKIFATQDELLKWARDVSFEMSFIVVILRSDTSNRQPGQKTFVVLGCEKGEKYR
ncbi:hypothetical protein GmHk_17G049980 [Glycine max]|nr:hypothetical protein GmHk_17G049980 [Glycine max]